MIIYLIIDGKNVGYKKQKNFLNILNHLSKAKVTTTTKWSKGWASAGSWSLELAEIPLINFIEELLILRLEIILSLDY